MRRIVLVVHNVRSAHNVGSLLRSADGFGVEKVYLTGYTPYPIAPHDRRLPHVAKRAEQQIVKTALGAERSVKWHHEPNILELIPKLKDSGYLMAALEQTENAIDLPDFKVSGNIALIVGNEIGGIEPSILEKANVSLEIPMLGNKESFNISVAAAVALYHLRYAG